MEQDLDRIFERVEITEAGLKVLSEHLDRIGKELDKLDPKHDPYIDGYNDGAKDERERILEILKDRASDLESCHKRDDCQEMARIVRVCIDDITYQVEDV